MGFPAQRVRAVSRSAPEVFAYGLNLVAQEYRFVTPPRILGERREEAMKLLINLALIVGLILFCVGLFGIPKDDFKSMCSDPDVIAKLEASIKSETALLGVQTVGVESSSITTDRVADGVFYCSTDVYFSNKTVSETTGSIGPVGSNPIPRRVRYEVGSYSPGQFTLKWTLF
jgi:hypothetical protein